MNYYLSLRLGARVGDFGGRGDRLDRRAVRPVAMLLTRSVFSGGWHHRYTKIRAKLAGLVEIGAAAGRASWFAAICWYTFASRCADGDWTADVLFITERIKNVALGKRYYGRRVEGFS